MSHIDQGRCTWFFPDGDLPPEGGGGSEAMGGHESLMILNPNDREARVS